MTCSRAVIARCGALVKGYGSTNERGKENLIWIIEGLAAGGTFATAGERGRAIRDAREAALADEAAAASLGVAVGTPVLSIERVAFTYGERPVELRRAVYLTVGHHYHNELS